jgi:hypothetical protein
MEKIAGCDFHPQWQQIAVFNAETGEIGRTQAGKRGCIYFVFLWNTFLYFVDWHRVGRSSTSSRFRKISRSSCFCGSTVCNPLILHRLMFCPSSSSQNRSSFTLPHAGPKRLRFRVGKRGQAG